MMECSTLIIDYQSLDGAVNFFRCVISNSAILKKDVGFLQEEIERLGKDIDP